MAPKTAREVFDVWAVNRQHDPRIVLLNRIMGTLTKKASVELITEVLVKEWENDRKLIPFLDALECIFEEDGVAFREHLRSIFTRFVNDYDRAPELYPVILAKILKGWNWRWNGDRCEVSEDAEACFQYFCKVYPRNREYREKVWLGVLRNHIDASYYGRWKFQDFDPWIIREDTPGAIVAVLFHAQIRMGGVSRMTNWIKST